MKQLLFPLVCLFTFGATAQDSARKILRGVVTSATEDVVGVVVQNISSDEAVITDIDGNFTIRVQVNDTLVFSAVHFQRKLLPVTEAVYNSNFVTVPLEEFVNELREVVVSPYNLSGVLDKDLEKLPPPRIVDAEALGLPNANAKDFTQSERKLNEAVSGSGIVPLNPIINAITGRTKMLKNRLEVDNTYARTQRVQDFYVDSLFVTTLKIPMEKIEDFMYFCEVDEAFQTTVDSQDKLKIWDFMVQKSRVYRENNNLD
ncbi:hypothetical protein J0X14_09920 [Muricauda sp. CAU 1633]|uniref:carboxypeptidase-like regulatory domain-containing protein n=1 Tax=Allomuricauda sp. CAU 1633 TaxID=2816036 RepID=UPI001A8D7A39|nr:carboxypeptidase-like regulatory domain-containing protein [Muricauda sp. CAU 1633]MBO0322612.1 hypothetical protein [Muricauda sp. CAU 1633]